MKYFLLFIALFMTSVCFAELPEKPTINQLCENSNIIIQGRVVGKSKLKDSNGIEYSFMTVSVKLILKGKQYFEDDFADEKEELRINILIQESFDWPCPRKAVYKLKKNYVFFLERTALENLYTRSRSIVYFKEFKNKKKLVNDIKSVLKIVKQHNN